MFGSLVVYTALLFHCTLGLASAIEGVALIVGIVGVGVVGVVGVGVGVSTTFVFVAFPPAFVCVSTFG